MLRYIKRKTHITVIGLTE